MTNRKVVTASIAAAITIAGAVQAQDYPTQSIDVIVPTSAGGLTDLLVRTAAQHMSEELGQPLVIENRPGAGTVVGITAAMKADPNGYTLVTPPASGFSINPNLRDLEYDPVADFEGICLMGGAPSILVVNPELGITNFEEFLAKATADELLFASAGPGTPSHLVQELLKIELDKGGVETDFVHVPYKGTAQAVTDAIGGHAQVLFESPGPLIGGIKAGQLVPLGVSSPKRLAALPDVPTFAELGYPGVELIGWVGMAAPKGTPKEIIDTLGAACLNATSTPEYAKMAEDNGLQVFTAGPAEFDTWIADQIQHYGALVEAAGLEKE
ncbi:Bug family tripartite tricarboxylate transporter substrate binding protein [Celeribacter naphthalenivorans]|uniref:Bug family tripartite tricarboxylate transporter substrate binding protein n=1 Tax=Celeribacter naphthalenivorans TaxID=1614694 RepID=UPI001CF9BBA1|nr:tripartite tricarboxylate transporter substrate binding protein [Celeribacter naphthalenivorans]